MADQGERMRQAQRDAKAARAEADLWREAAEFIAPLLDALAEPGTECEFDNWAHAIAEGRRLIAAARRFDAGAGLSQEVGG